MFSRRYVTHELTEENVQIIRAMINHKSSYHVSKPGLIIIINNEEV